MLTLTAVKDAYDDIVSNLIHTDRHINICFKYKKVTTWQQKQDETTRTIHKIKKNVKWKQKWVSTRIIRHENKIKYLIYE